MASRPDAAGKPGRPLTRARVLRAAVELADARGIGGQAAQSSDFVEAV
jgi:hypothetical protein